MNPKMLTDIELVTTYNKLVRKVKKTPKFIRRNAMPNQSGNRQLLLDEIQKRAMLDTSKDLLSQLDH